MSDDPRDLVSYAKQVFLGNRFWADDCDRGETLEPILYKSYQYFFSLWATFEKIRGLVIVFLGGHWGRGVGKATRL